ncbi:hypothetical protein DVH24_033451 [Malus domestica]|uniref:Uncharacterized protein n=1 Tax=Malus domestica TaxID=3750 RepID=A0A498JCJ2_MALDO|nr:hypothetical protein DVH24_033451 [Malus domestica]
MLNEVKMFLDSLVLIISGATRDCLPVTTKLNQLKSGVHSAIHTEGSRSFNRELKILIASVVGLLEMYLLEEMIAEKMNIIGGPSLYNGH